MRRNSGGADCVGLGLQQRALGMCTGSSLTGQEVAGVSGQRGCCCVRFCVVLTAHARIPVRAGIGCAYRLGAVWGSTMNR